MLSLLQFEHYDIVTIFDLHIIMHHKGKTRLLVQLIQLKKFSLQKKPYLFKVNKNSPHTRLYPPMVKFVYRKQSQRENRPTLILFDNFQP